MNAIAGLIIASSLWLVWTRTDYHSLTVGKTWKVSNATNCKSGLGREQIRASGKELRAY